MSRLFDVNDVDRRFYQERLQGFLPEKIIDVHTHVWRDGDVMGASIIGVVLLALAIIAGPYVVANPTLADYKLCTSREAPEIVTLMIEGAPGAGPFHAKSIGELPTCPIAPAVANAVFDAIGVRITDLPITGEKIVKALKESGLSASPRGAEKGARA